MKEIRSGTLKVLVLVALFCSVALADGGDMGGGGLADSGTAGKAGKSVIIRTTEDGDMGGGGRLSESSYLDRLITSMYEYFDWTR